MPSAGRLIAMVCCAEILSMTAFSGFVTLLPVLAPEFGLNNSQAGLIGGTVLGGYVLAVPFLGPLSDRIDPRRVYAAAALATACGALGFSVLASGFWSALLCQALIGCGLAGTYVPGMKALTDRVHGPWQSRGAAIYGATFGIGASGSLVFTGAVASTFGWQAAFFAASAGPLLAGAIIVLALKPVPPRTAVRRALLDFRPVFRNAAVRAFVFASAAHSWELHATRAWLVAFFAFAADLRGGSVPVSAALTVAVIYLLGPLASISGNELALRIGRPRVMTLGPILSAIASGVIGFVAGWPWAALVALAAMHMCFIGIDAGAMTSGVVNAAEPAYRGASMTMHSLIGFGTGFVSPTIFGVVLDLAGGRGESMAWGLAFASLGAVALLGIIPARRLARRNQPSASARSE